MRREGSVQSNHEGGSQHADFRFPFARLSFLVRTGTKFRIDAYFLLAAGEPSGDDDSLAKGGGDSLAMMRLVNIVKERLRMGQSCSMAMLLLLSCVCGFPFFCF